MDNNKTGFPVFSYTLLTFVFLLVFEVLKTDIFMIKELWLSRLSTIIVVTLGVSIFLLWLKQAIIRHYQEFNQELQNARISAAAANQQLQATNQELETMENELRLTNDQLEQQKQDLDLLVQTIPEGIIRTDIKGKVLFCNKRILEETGLNQEDILNKDIKNIVSLDDRPAFAKELARVFIQGTIKELSFHSRQGTQVLADVVLLKDKRGQISGTLSAIREFSKTGKIIEELNNSRKELRQKIEEMQLLHRTTIDREKRIIALKEQVEVLKQELAKNGGQQNQ